MGHRGDDCKWKTLWPTRLAPVTYVPRGQLANAVPHLGPLTQNKHKIAAVVRRFAPTSTGTLSTGTGCLDVFGVLGPGLDVFPCNKSPNQQFVANAAGVGSIAAAGSSTCLAAVPPTQAGLWVSSTTTAPAPVPPPPPPPRGGGGGGGGGVDAAGAGGDAVQLWNLARPYMYTLETTVNSTFAPSTSTSTSPHRRPHGAEVQRAQGVQPPPAARTMTDRVVTKIGVRSAVFNADQGFVLNGLAQKVKGLSMHQDFGGCAS